MDTSAKTEEEKTEKDLDCEEVPINNASNSMTTSYNVSVAEVQFYL